LEGLKTALALLAAVVSAGCATSRTPRETLTFKTPRRASLEEVLAAYDGYCDALRAFSGSGDLEVRDLRAGRSRKVRVRVVAAREGKLYLKGSVLVVTALELVSDGSRFWLQIPSKKTVWTGPNGASHEAQDDEHAPYYALRPGDITSALLPDAIPVDGEEALAFEGDPEAFSVSVLRMKGERGFVRRRIWLDRETLHLLRWRVYGESGDTVAEAVFGGWSGGMPHEVQISRPLQGYAAAFVLDKAEANVTVPERAFSSRVPEGYVVREVGEQP
jgi:outer membrane lipoprotein-sorting protein